MSRYHLIRAIFEKVPGAERGISKSGFHMVSISHSRIPMYATLEQLPADKLIKLAERLGVVAPETATE